MRENDFLLLMFGAIALACGTLAYGGHLLRERARKRREAVAARSGWALLPSSVDTVPWVTSYFPPGTVRFAAEVRPGLVFAEHVELRGRRKSPPEVRLLVAAEDEASQEVASFDAGDGWSLCVEHGRVIIYRGPFLDGTLVGGAPAPETWPELVATAVRVASRSLGRTIGKGA